MNVSLRGIRLTIMMLSAVVLAQARTSAQWNDNGPTLYTYDEVSIGTSWALYPLTVIDYDDRVIYGLNSKGGGWTTYGVAGRINSAFGAGVFGEAPNSGYAAGVLGSTSSSGGIGVKGESTSTSGIAKGVWGVSNASAGVGVMGYGYNGAHGVLGYAYGGGHAIYGSGTIAATGPKSFIQPHPDDPTTAVQFICLEGNEAGTYFRGTTRLVNGVGELSIPEEWQMVTDDNGITVQVAAHGPALLWVAAKSRERILVRGSADVEFDYTVNGVRRGFTKYEPYVPNRHFRPDVRGVPFGEQYPRELRDILVQNDILNADYTPNEATAARLGWKLRDPKDVPVSERYWLSAEQRRQLQSAQEPVAPPAHVRNSSRRGR